MRMSERSVTLLPQPDSPRRPTVWFGLDREIDVVGGQEDAAARRQSRR